MDKKQKLKESLEKQQYEFIGDHSAIKICEWTKKSIRGEGVCYKQKFYGIRSHLCCQMSVTVGFCQNACVFCWRDMDNTIGIEMKSDSLDDPDEIIKNSKLAQTHQLIGFYGLDKADKDKLDEGKEPMHYAISLTGDALIYPKLNDLIKKLHADGKTTFIVTNGLLPEKVKGIEPPTQLYISVDAPNEDLFKKIDKPMVKDAWSKLQESLKILSKMKDKTRTTLRLTLIKGINMEDVNGWADQIRLADPHFVEIKAYMWVGYSQKRLKLENMPYHDDVVEFAQKICDELGWKIIDEQESSRVVLIAKEDMPDRIMKF